MKKVTASLRDGASGRNDKAIEVVAIARQVNLEFVVNLERPDSPDSACITGQTLP